MITQNLIRYGGSFMPGLATTALGAYVEMDDGRRVLDFTSGQLSGILGHSHPAIVECIRRQSESLIHLFSGMLSEPVIELAERLSSLLPDSLSKVPVTQYRRGVQRGRVATGQDVYRGV